MFVKSFTAPRARWKLRLNLSRKFDVICERVTGGPFCRRASFCSDFARPSKNVLDHKAARTCVGFVFGVEEMKIDERLEYPVTRHAKDLAPSHSDQQRDSPPRKKDRKEKRSESRRHGDADDERRRLRRLEREKERELKYGSERMKERRSRKEKEKEEKERGREDSKTRKRREAWERDRARDESMERRGWRCDY